MQWSTAGKPTGIQRARHKWVPNFMMCVLCPAVPRARMRQDFESHLPVRACNVFSCFEVNKSIVSEMHHAGTATGCLYSSLASSVQLTVFLYRWV
jgi:hypothetical protein